MKKYNIITGWNRGGTSALMFALRHAGIPVVGFKFPLFLEFQHVDDPNTIMKNDAGLTRTSKKSKRNNPTGYWEIPSICLETGLQKKHLDIGTNGDLVKVLFEVLPASNPDLVDKAVIILRNPANIIRSQLLANEYKDKKGWIKIASLGMLYNAIISLKWLIHHKKQERIVFYEDLIEYPLQVLNDLCAFLKRGDPKWGAKVIDKKLNRSKPVKVNCRELVRLEAFYQSFLTKNPVNINDFDTNDLLKKINQLNKKLKVVQKIKRYG